MGNYKFSLSDMIRPNAWFHKKHKDTTITTCTDSSSKSLSNALAAAAAVPNQCPNNNTNTSTNNQQPHLSDPRKSYRFTHLHHYSQLINTNKFPVEPPRKSSRRKRRSTKKNRPLHNPNLASSVSASCSCRATRKAPVSTPEQYPFSHCSSELDSMLNEYGSEHSSTLTPDTFDAMLSSSASSCKCGTVHNNILLDIDNKTGQFHHKVPELAPIITKNHNHQKTSVQNTNTSPGFKMRANSPRIANKRIQGGRKSAARGSVYASFAVVKTSRDPRRDFRESMVEMIVEKNIMGSSKDLEQLLACYLSLNSDEYHDIIISVFKQIWFDFIHVPTK